MIKTATDVVSYITIFGWLIAFIVTNDKKSSELALNQGLVLGVLGLIGCALAAVIPVIGGIIGWVLGLVCLGFSILGIYNAIKNPNKELPVLGQIKMLSL